MSGEVVWHRVTYDIASGSHTITWSFTKDASDSEESDARVVGKVEFISAPAGS